MKLTFLGTGTSQGVPVITCECDVCRSKNPKDNRLRSSVLIEHQGKTFVIDTGPDFRQQMLREDVKHIEFVLLTHEQKDHTAGLDDIRALSIPKGKQPVTQTKELFGRTSEFANAFCKTIPWCSRNQFIEINNKLLKLNTYNSTPWTDHFKLHLVSVSTVWLILPMPMPVPT
jgi:phosphoribosyl 1,2-cyclic phosphate phosphodiesterase